MQTIARILLTLTVLGYGLATIKADFNRTHATNPTGRRTHAFTWFGKSCPTPAWGWSHFI